jgi:hypothetical protein
LLFDQISTSNPKRRVDSVSVLSKADEAMSARQKGLAVLRDQQTGRWVLSLELRAASYSGALRRITLNPTAKLALNEAAGVTGMAKKNQSLAIQISLTARFDSKRISCVTYKPEGDPPAKQNALQVCGWEGVSEQLVS